MQSLCNVQYLSYLAQMNFLEDESFINYLKYLQYWQLPEYAKNIVYPDSLHILTLLQSPHFRQAIKNQELAGQLMHDMVERWKEPVEVQK